jgi:hypothetical protein
VPAATAFLAAGLLGWALPTRAQTDEPAAPLLTASVNDEVSPTVCQGWPLVLMIGWVHPEMYQPSTNVFAIGSASVPWTNYLRLTLTDAADNPVDWPFQFIHPPSSSLLLSNDAVIEAGLHLTPQQTVALPTNHYRLTVVFDSQAATDPTTWKGVARSVPLEITVLPEPAPMPPDLTAQKALLQAGYAVSLGRPEQAGPVLDQLLLNQPTHVAVLSSKATLQEEQGDVSGALASIGAALDSALRQNADSPEAPVALFRQQNRLLQKLNAPRLTSVEENAGQLTLGWTGWPGESYAVEGSHDLQVWTSLATNVVSATTNQVWSTNITSSPAFYRLRW